MQFKHSIEPASAPFKKLLMVLECLDAYSQAVGCGEIVITSLYRPDDLDSYHSKFQAADIRINDKPSWWIMAVELIMTAFKQCDDTIQLDRHLELRNTVSEHLHIEIDTGDL